MDTRNDIEISPSPALVRCMGCGATVAACPNDRIDRAEPILRDPIEHRVLWDRERGVWKETSSMLVSELRHECPRPGGPPTLEEDAITDLRKVLR